MKYALVTGGSRGIGKATCLALADMGYNILVNYKSNNDAAEIAVYEIRMKNVEAEMLCFDVADSIQVQQTLGVWMDNNKEKHIEILVNNAGIRNDALLIFMTDDQWKSVTHSAIDGFFNVTKLVINGMLTRRYGRIINVVSLSGLKGMPGQTNYSTAKAGVIGATKALAQEVARRGVTVNAVAPGFIITDMTSDLNEEELKKIVPVQRFGQAYEVADTIAFLASTKASYITAEVININGGLYS